MFALLILGQWVVDTLGPSDALSQDAAARNPVSGAVGVAFVHGDTVFLAERAGSVWVVDTVGVFQEPGPPALAFDTLATPYLAFVERGNGGVPICLRREGGLWKGGVVDDPDSSEEDEALRVSVVINRQNAVFLPVEFAKGGLGKIGFYATRDTVWEYNFIAEGYYYEIDTANYEKLVLSGLSPGTVYENTVEFLYNYDYEYRRGDYDTLISKVYDRYATVLDDDSHENLNAWEYYFVWEEGQTLWINNYWFLWLARADMARLPGGLLVAAGKRKGCLTVASRGDFWWYETLPEEKPLGLCSVALTPDSGMFIAYQEEDGSLHIAHKKYTLVEEGPGSEPRLLRGTLFSRDEELRLSQRANITIYDITGRSVISGSFDRIRLSNFSCGVYFIEAKGLGRARFVVIP